MSERRPMSKMEINKDRSSTMKNTIKHEDKYKGGITPDFTILKHHVPSGY